MLCLLGRTRCVILVGSLSVPSCGTSNVSHSSSVATCPASNEKNLWRRTNLMRSNAWVVNHPSRSCEGKIELMCAKSRRDSAYTARFPKILLLFHHLLEHRIMEVTQLKSGGLLRYRLSIEYVRPAAP